jgi:two-component system sensor histidine kinase VicK
MLSARKLPVSNDNAYMCLVVTDMTERRRVENAKDEFISLASHQLRTPATGVKQYVGMLLEGYAGELTADQKTFAQTAFDSNERQLAIINSILKTAQIDFGAYQLKISEQDMKQLIEETLIAFRPMLMMRRQTISCEFEEEVCAMVEPIEISLVVSNLIENASKYSPEGGQITIKLKREKKFAIVSISDDGVGIKDEDHAKIFEKFTRIDNVLSDTVSGSGLGLYWVKKIVELHGGEINLSSMLNVGSTFTIRLRAC